MAYTVPSETVSYRNMFVKNVPEGVQEIILIRGTLSGKLPSTLKILHMCDAEIDCDLPDTIEECYFSNVKNVYAPTAKSCDFIPADIKKLHYLNKSPGEHCKIQHCHKLFDLYLHNTTIDSYPPNIFSLTLSGHVSTSLLIPQSVNVLNLHNIIYSIMFADNSELLALYMHGTTPVSHIPLGTKSVNVYRTDIPLSYSKLKCPIYKNGLLYDAKKCFHCGQHIEN